MEEDVILLPIAAEALVVDDLSDTSNTPESFEVGIIAGPHLDIVLSSIGNANANKLHALASLGRFHKVPGSSRLQREQVPDLEWIFGVAVESRNENIVLGQRTLVVPAEFANGRLRRSFHAGSAVDVLEQDFKLHTSQTPHMVRITGIIR
jgi:hypothetical protein